MVVRRRDKLWVFACGSGIGEGALELYRFARTADPSLRLVWLVRSRTELGDARQRGLKAATRSSWRGFRLTLRARVVVVTHGLGDANRFGMHGAFIVQLWHGIPLKRIQLDSPSTFRGFAPRLTRALYRRSASRIDLVPAASEVSAERLRSAFGLSADRVVLYAPTWRDGESDPSIPTDAEWASIAAHLDSNSSVLVVRPHPYSVGDYRAGTNVSSRIRLLPASTQNDINAVLPAVDILITDYSSTTFDFALLGRPIVFLAPDAETYTRTRGLYEPYRQFSGGSDVATWGDVITLLSDDRALSRLSAHAHSLVQAHHTFRDGRNTERLYAELRRRLKGKA
jgi:CDP-glycerol glycerophosphotransferase